MRRTVLSLTFGLLGLGLILAGCGSTASGTPASAAASPTVAATATPAGPKAAISVKMAKVAGKETTVLANDKGKTLYYFVPDTTNTVACTASCAQLWPPVLTPGGIPTTTATLSGMLSYMDGVNGRQATYNGHPLYAYTKDEDSEDAYGQGFAGKWYVATPDISQNSGGSSGGYGP